MPVPVSRTVIAYVRVRVASEACTLDPPAVGVNLMAFDSRFQTICCSTVGIAAIGPTPSSIVLDADLFGVGGRPHRLDRLAQDIGQVHGPNLQPQVSADDARHVEQVVDQLGCARAFRSIACMAAARCSSRTVPVASIRAHPWMAVSGVRSSCDTVIRNSCSSLSAFSSRLVRRSELVGLELPGAGELALPPRLSRPFDGTARTACRSSSASARGRTPWLPSTAGEHA